MASFTVGDYKYTTFTTSYGEVATMEVADTSKTSYANPTGTVEYEGVVYPVTSMLGCFEGCTNLVVPPDLSDMTQVRSLDTCFHGCTSLQVPPDISSMTSITVLDYCFWNCTSLVIPPDLSSIPSDTSVAGCFSGCTALRGFLRIGVDCDSSFSASLFNGMDGTGATTDPLYLVVPAADRSKWLNYSKPSRVQVIPASASGTTATMAPYDYTYSTDANGQLTSLRCKVNSSYTSQTSYPPIDASVTSMYYCFYGCSSLTTSPDLSNMTAVTSMECCFSGCTSLTTPPDLSNMTAVTNMSYCFKGTGLTSPPDLSNMAAVTTMSNCFADCTSLTTPPDLSNMTAVTTMSYCFKGTGLTTPPDLSNMTAVTNMSYCFYKCGTLATPPDLSNMTAVTTMSNCFRECSMLSAPPDMSNMTEVTDMSYCFYQCSSLTTPPDLSDMTAVTNMSYCLCGCTSLTTPPDLSNMTAVTSMEGCFQSCTSLTIPPDLSSMTAVMIMVNCFDRCTSLTTPPNLSNMTSVTRMDSCFARCTGLTIPPDLSDMTAVVIMSSCFSNCTSLLIPPDLSKQTSVWNMQYCFAYCTNLIVPPDLSNMTDLVTMQGCFVNCYNLRGFLKIGTTTTPDNLQGGVSIFRNVASVEDLYLIVPSSQRTNWTNLSKPSTVKVIGVNASSSIVDYNFGYDATVYMYIYSTNSSGQLTSLQCKTLNAPVKNDTYYDFPPIDTRTTSLNHGFYLGDAEAVYPWYDRYTNAVDGLKYPDFSSLREVTDLGYCFSNCTGLTIPPDLSNMTAVTNMLECFANCSSLTTPPDLSNMTAVTNMSGCFYTCSSLATPPDLSNMTAVTNMLECFAYCSNLTTPPDLSNMTAVTEMGYCFQDCTSLTTPPDMSGLTAVTDMMYCFKGCSGLTTPPDLSNMTAVTNMYSCFYGCSSLTTPPNMSNMTAVTSMKYCFGSCSNLTTPPDLSDMTAVTNMSNCFAGCRSLTTPPNMSNMTAVTDMFDCFINCISLTTPPDLSDMTAVTSMLGCFASCYSLTTPPDMSNMTAVTNMVECFNNCRALSGDLRVGSRALSLCTNAFRGTTGDIWIVPTEDVTGSGTASAPVSSGDAAWFNLYRQGNGMPSNVHFYSPYLNPSPTSGLSVQRIESFDGYFIEGPTGAILMATVMKPQVYATRVKAMPTVRKISLWVGTAEDEQYIRERLSIDEDVGYTEVRQVLYNQDPSALGYYEYDSANDAYVSTADTSPVSGKKYYALVVGEALSRGLGFTKILYRPNPDAPDNPASLRIGDLSLYTNGDYVDMGLSPSTLTFDRFYTFLTRDTTTQVVALFVEDSCQHVSKYVVKIPKSFATFSFLKPGGGVGVGIPARRNGFDVDMQAFFEYNPMVYDVPTLPVVVTYASTIADDAHLPDPCLVVRIDPGYLWSRANPSAPIPNDGFQIYLRGSMLERLPQRAGRAFVTTPPLSGGGTGWTVLGSAMGEAKVDTYLPGSVPVSSSQADRWSPASDAGQLLVSVTGCEKVVVEFQNGNDSDGTGGAHFELYEIDTSYVQGAVPVATSTSDESYTFTHLDCKPHTFEVRPVSDSSQYSSETTAPTAYVRIVPDPES